jgi:ribosomal protein S27E
MAVEIKCQGCGAVLSVDAEANTRITCPQCHTSLVVPATSTAGAAAAIPIEIHRFAWRRIVDTALPWALSVAMHGALLLMMGFIVWATAQDTSGKDPREQIIIPGTGVGGTPGGSLHPGPADDPLESRQNLDPKGDTGFSQANEIGIGTDFGGKPGAFDVVGSSAGDASALAGAIGGVGSGVGSGAGGPMAPFSPIASGSGHGPPSQFMGTGGNAFCVCYIIDRSGSMVIAFDYVKKEMLRSIQELQAEQLFHVIFFNAGEPMESPVGKMVHASDRNKIEAIRFIGTVVAAGRTDPRPAFRRAFALKPRPNLIYFLTDGDFDPDLLDDLRKWNSDHKTAINTIAFLERPAEALLKQIAQENSGTYTFVNPTAPGDSTP